MSIYNSPIFTVDAKETRRYAGLQKADFSEAMIEDACSEAQLLIQPKGNWEIYNYDSETQTILGNTPIQLQGKSIGNHLQGCEKVILLTATVGEAIEEQVTKSFEEGHYTAAILLDAAATTAVEQVADNMEKTIFNEVKRQGYMMKWRFSPGYGDWPIQQQPEILELAKGSVIGVSLTESLMLMPRKSITAIIGLYHPAPDCPAEPAKKHDCSQCSKLDCLSRKV